jgi:hypothetical protein
MLIRTLSHLLYFKLNGEGDVLQGTILSISPGQILQRKSRLPNLENKRLSFCFSTVEHLQIKRNATEK